MGPHSQVKTLEICRAVKRDWCSALLLKRIGARSVAGVMGSTPLISNGALLVTVSGKVWPVCIGSASPQAHYEMLVSSQFVYIQSTMDKRPFLNSIINMLPPWSPEIFVNWNWVFKCDLQHWCKYLIESAWIWYLALGGGGGLCASFTSLSLFLSFPPPFSLSVSLSLFNLENVWCLGFPMHWF